MAIPTGTGSECLHLGDREQGVLKVCLTSVFDVRSPPMATFLATSSVAAGKIRRRGADLCSIRLEATPRIELGMEVLQTSALPLGYVAPDRKSILPARWPRSQLATSPGCAALRAEPTSDNVGRLGYESLATAGVQGRHGAAPLGRGSGERSPWIRVPRTHREQPRLDLGGAPAGDGRPRA